MIYLNLPRFCVLLLLLGSLPLSLASLRITLNAAYSNFEPIHFNSTSSPSSPVYIRDNFTSLRIECSPSSNQTNVSLLCGPQFNSCSGSVKEFNSTENFISNYICQSNTTVDETQNITITIVLGSSPLIDTQNESLVYLAENDTSILVVEISSIPLPNAEWYLNSSLIQPATMTNISTLSIPFNNSFGNYTVVARNIFGIDSTSFDVRLGRAPRIISLNPTTSPLHVLSGMSVNLTVIVTAVPPPNRVVWRRDSNGLSGYLNLTSVFGETIAYTLYIPSFAANLTGNYTFVAESDLGVDSRSFDLRLGKVPNIITLNPTVSPLYLLSGTTFNLTVIVTAIPPPTIITWELLSNSTVRNLTALFPATSSIHGSNITNTLSIASFAANLSGIYIFVVENTFGNVSTSFDVRLGKIPRITSPNGISHLYALCGQSVTLSFVATSVPPPNRITWELDSIELVGLPNATTQSDESLTYTLSIPSVILSSRMTRNYTVRVWNQFGRDNITFIITRGLPPQPSSAQPTYVTNSSVTLDCSSNATPPVLTINCSMWHFNNVQLCNSRMYSFTGTRLTIPLANETHAGVYRCTPENMFGSANITFDLMIHTRPTFSQGGEVRNLTLNASQSLNLSCTAQGIPTPQIRWTLDDLPFPSRYIQTNGAMSVLSFDSLIDVMNGMYRCIAESNITISPIVGIKLVNATSNGTLLTVIPLPPTTRSPSPHIPLYRDTFIFTGVFCTAILLILGFTVAFAIVCLLKKRYRSVRIMELNSHEKAISRVLEMSMVPSEKNFVLVPKEHTMIDSLSETGVIEDIKVRNIGSYIEELKANDLLGFSEQYDLIRRKSAEHSYSVGDLMENKSRNRYNNIFCYDHSRVKLTPIDDTHTDFIHANFITGYNREREYIATQGPLENTIEDFWRMIWEYHCSTIVMLTKCMENLKKKCAYYWVDEGVTTFFEMIVSHISSLHLVDYSIIILNIRPVDFTGDEMQVYLFQFVSWPDFGTPDSPAGLLHFRNKIREVHPYSSTSPMLVHCSAGVGRSGTFISLDMELQKAAIEDRINPFNRVIELREERNFLVQTEAQYVFLHYAILEGILFGYEDTPVTDLPILIDNLYKVDEEAKKTGFELDFQALTMINIDSRQFSDGNLPCNCNKNRRTQILPHNKNRIKLTMIPGVEGSDYINASLIDSYAFKNVFIATQAPLESTMCDFWRMIFERNVQTVIMLCDLVERNTEVCVKYWPELGESLDLGAVVVTNEGEESSGELRIVERDLKVEYKKLNSSQTLKQYHFTGWIDNRTPDEFNGLIELLDITNEVATENRKSPILVQCTSGIGRTGVFLALYNSIEQVTFEESVNLFYVIKKLRLQRAHTIQSIHQYEFCYHALSECLRAIEEKVQ